jgi:hypothetical protein
VKSYRRYLIIGLLLEFSLRNASAQNPIIRNQFTADPTARVFEGKMYLFPSHDIPTPEGKGLRKDWFCMEDYHVFSSENLTEWKDHGVIVAQTEVPWLTKLNYDMWAPDCVLKNGKYYFYFPVDGKIGVATAQKPEGPYTILKESVAGIGGIDPCVLLDKDGQAYIFVAKGRISVARLKPNMVEVDSIPMVIANLPNRGLIEGPFTFEHNGKYYLTYPHVENKIERLEYAMSDNPMGPYEPVGVIMDESASGCWTNHQSIVNFKGCWYLFYHDQDLSPKFDKNRSVKIDSLFFNADGTIRKVIPTLRGVGLTKATEQIQIDRYTSMSDKGATISFIDSANTFSGWKTLFSAKDAWIKYNAVDFGKKKFKSVVVKVASKTGGNLQVRLNSLTGHVVAKINIPKGDAWQMVKVAVSGSKTGVQNLVISSADNSQVEVDWISFE